MERMMLLKEVKMGMHSLGNTNTSVRSSGRAVSLWGFLCNRSVRSLGEKKSWRQTKLGVQLDMKSRKKKQPEQRPNGEGHSFSHRFNSS